jgi:hypothetical protein
MYFFGIGRANTTQPTVRQSAPRVQVTPPETTDGVAPSSAQQANKPKATSSVSSGLSTPSKCSTPRAEGQAPPPAMPNFARVWQLMGECPSATEDMTAITLD